MSSPASPSQRPSCGQLQNPTLDQSQSALANMEQALAPDLQEDPQPSSPASDSPSLQSVQPQPVCLHSDPHELPVPTPSSEISHTCTSPAETSTASQDPEGEVQPGATEGSVGKDEVENSAMHTTPEDLSPGQPMEQEVTHSEAADSTETCPIAPSQPESVEMECPPISHSVPSTEGDRRPSSDSIPSLAAALKELHELLVSNNQAQSQNRSTSCSPSHPRGQDSDKASSEPGTPTPENTLPLPSTAIAADAETSDAKADYAAAAVSDEEPSQALEPDLPGQEEHLGPDGPEERAEDEQQRDETIRIAQPDPEGSLGPELVPEFREPPEGQHGGESAGAQVSDTNSQEKNQTEHTFLSPLSVEVDSPEDVSSTSSSSSAPLLTQAPQATTQAPLLPSPRPFIEQFPAEHIQRIQAAGFSAREAVEALEQAQGVVELALIALLARSITVPT